MRYLSVTGLIYASNVDDRVGLNRSEVGDLTACGFALPSCPQLDAVFDESGIDLPLSDTPSGATPMAVKPAALVCAVFVSMAAFTAFL